MLGGGTFRDNSCIVIISFFGPIDVDDFVYTKTPVLVHGLRLPVIM